MGCSKILMLLNSWLDRNQAGDEGMLIALVDLSAELDNMTQDEICESVPYIDEILNCIDSSIQHCNNAVARLAGNDDNASSILENHGMAMLVKLSSAFINDPSVLQEVILVISKLCFWVPKDDIKYGVEVVIQAMSGFPNCDQLQCNSCLVIKNLLDKQENRALLHNHGIETLLENAKRSHNSCKVVATDALRLLFPEATAPDAEHMTTSQEGDASKRAEQIFANLGGPQIPTGFMKENLSAYKENTDYVLEVDQSSETWNAKFLYNKDALSWAAFSKCHKLLADDYVVLHLVASKTFKGIAIEKAVGGSSSKLQYKIDQMDKGEIQIKINNLRFELKKVELLIKHKDEKIEIMENSI
ncbi:hypothetical protein OROMI_016707 [Orobanche minor]